jgi:hypothetical protein
MKWEIPCYEEIKMDAEIGSYQADPEVPDGIITPEARARVGFARRASATATAVPATP